MLEADDWAPIIWDEPRGPGDIRHLNNCGERAFDETVRGPWATVENLYKARDREAIHRVSDRVIRRGEPAKVGVVLDYEGEPMEGEGVRLFLGDCEGWSHQGVVRSDEEGVARFALQEELEPGIYGMAFQVMGDASVAQSQLWVLAEETAMHRVVLGEARPQREALKMRGEQGELTVYVDPRGEVGEALEQWRWELRSQGFPVGPVVDEAVLRRVSNDGVDY